MKLLLTLLLWTGGLLSGVFLLALLLLIRNSVLPPLPNTLHPRALGLAAEEVTVVSRDGIRLHGWWIPQTAPRPVIILCHGLGANRSDLLELARALVHAGYQVLLFDFRAHGESQGRVTSFGWTEQRDVEAMLDWLRRQPAAREVPWGLYGLSMGGAVGIQVAARTPEVQAVVVDSAYRDLERSILIHVRLLYHIPTRWLRPILSAAYRVRYGVWPHTVSPRWAASQLGERALFVINGALDVRMPAEDARALYEAASGPKELWIVEGAVHLGGYSVDPALYHRRIAAFFQQHLPISP